MMGRFSATKIARAFLINCGVLALLAGGSAAMAQSGGAKAAPVTFEEVLANPGDIRLNFRYARQQVAAGDLTGAAVTLERILIAHPQLQDIRLFYAIILYRLDNYLESETELKRIATDKLPAELKAEVEKYLALIERRRRRTRFYAIASLGAQYDTNITSAPASEMVTVANINFPVAGAEDDFGFFARGTLGASHDLGLQIESELVGELTLYGREQIEEDSQSTKLIAGKIGSAHHFSWGDLEPSLRLSWLQLSHEPFYKSIGPDVAVSRRINKDLKLRGTAGFTYEDFDGIAESALAHERTGFRIDAGAGFDYTILPTLLAKGTGTFTRKMADENYEEYTGGRLDASLTTLLFGDHFLQGSVAVGLREYDAPDLFFSTKTRGDKFATLRVAYGLPIASVARSLTGTEPSFLLEDLMLVPSIELYRQVSNITNFEYDNARFMLTLSKRFDW
ncbi:MAG: hypothetical protein QF893_18420 [Alphaproteobacteria bacterium]|nr:hypothetical protein [Alphaproteobacteria bacterium]